MMKFQKPLEDYIQFYEKLTARSLPLIEGLVSPIVRIKTPEHDDRGSDAYRAQLEHFLAYTGGAPKFKVTDRAWGQDGHTVYLRWECHFTRNGQPAHIDAVSEVTFDIDGKVISHIDRWSPEAEVAAQKPAGLSSLVSFVRSHIKS